MAITREIDLTWQGASKPFAPTITSIVRIENAVRKATERPDFSIAEVLMRLDKDPVMFAVVWGSMLTLAGHELPDGVSPADAMEHWYQEAWQALTSAATDKIAMQDLTSARDVIYQMVAPTVDLGKPAAPPAKAAGARKKRATASR
jgi:hypothetical protein